MLSPASQGDRLLPSFKRQAKLIILLGPVRSELSCLCIDLDFFEGLSNIRITIKLHLKHLL